MHTTNASTDARHASAILADLSHCMAHAFADAVCVALPDVAASWGDRAGRAKRAESIDRVGDAMRSLAANVGLLRKFACQEAEARFAWRVSRLVGASSHPHDWILAGLQADSQVQVLESVMIDHYMQSRSSHLPRELGLLSEGVAAIAGNDAMHDVMNPLSPRLLAESLLAAMSPFGAQPHVRLSLFRAFVPMLDEIFARTYAEVARHFGATLYARRDVSAALLAQTQEFRAAA